MFAEAWTVRSFRVGLVLIALAYFSIQMVYVSRLPLAMDEFDGAYEAHRLSFETPYRDFTPYKTVLGYWLQSLPLRTAGSPWEGLMRVKFALAALNTAALIAVGLALGRRFRFESVIASMAFTVLVSSFLERSSDLRVEMLTAWFGVATLLLLIERRFAISGLICGLGFCVSQREALYWVAANLAIAAVVGTTERWPMLLRKLVAWNLGFILPVAAYVGAWSLVAGPQAVITATFLAHADTVTTTFYEIQGRYWGQTILRNWFFWGLSAVAIWRLESLRARRHSWAHDVTLVFASVLLLLSIWYRQPWPYFFVLVIPVLFILHAAFLDAEFATAPLRLTRPILAAAIAFGIILPLSRIPVVVARDNSYQRQTVEIARAVLRQPSDTYMAGTDLVYDRKQTIPELSRMDAIMLARLNSRSAPEIEALIRAIDRTPPKLLINNYRLAQFPKEIRSYFASHYERLWASVYTYAPLIEDRQSVDLKFDGIYMIDVSDRSEAVIDGRPAGHGSRIALNSGQHVVETRTPVRLRLLPDGLDGLLDPDSEQQRDLYPSVYDY